MRKLTILRPLLGAGILGGCGSGNEAESPTRAAPAAEAPAAIKVTAGAVDTTVKKEQSKENSGQFYYAYNREKNVTEEPPKVRTTIDAYLHIRSPYEKVRITMMIKRLSKNYIIKCSACHDDYANGVIGPSLLDKNATYIYDHIVAFKTGTKKNVLMKELVTRMDDTEIRGLAEEIANFNKQIRKMRSGK